MPRRGKPAVSPRLSIMHKVTSPRLAIALSLVLWSQLAMAQSSPKAAMLEQQAWAALDAGKAQVAEQGFRDAIALDPKNARLHLAARGESVTH